MDNKAASRNITVHSLNQSTVRSMFWRVWLRSLAVKRPQSALAFAALALGAAVASLLLNLYGGARRKMQSEFRAYGPNVILAPATDQPATADSATSPGRLIEASLLARLQSELRSAGLPASKPSAVPVLYTVVSARPVGKPDSPASNLVGVGTDLPALSALNPAWRVGGPLDKFSGDVCVFGAHAAERLGLKSGDKVAVSITGLGAAGVSALPSDTRVDEAGNNQATFTIAGLISSGGPEEDQVFLRLEVLQQLSGLAGKISLVEMRISGTSSEVESAISRLAQTFPSLEVRPVREIVQSEGQVLNTIRGLMLALSALILGVVVLCVMATVTTIVLERAKEVAVMKALGASERTLFGLLLAEIGALGISGGLVGFAVGAAVARRFGVDLFGVALDPDWRALLPVLGAALLTSALPALVPVWSVRSIDPARALRGE
jgi:putative ABC transport system permease protein